MQPTGFKIDFVRNLISGSAEWFFIIILKFILTSTFEIKIYKKIPWHEKKLIFEGVYRQRIHYLTLTAWEKKLWGHVWTIPGSNFGHRQKWIIQKKICIKMRSNYVRVWGSLLKFYDPYYLTRFIYTVLNLAVRQIRTNWRCGVKWSGWI